MMNVWSMCRASGVLALLVSPTLALAATVRCDIPPPSMPSGTTNWLSPVAIELSHAMTRLGEASGVLTQSLDETLAVDAVLARIRFDGCRSMASRTAPAAAPGQARAAGYKPETAYDNRPWRFNMTQNGRRMTADEFDAWMKARGVRVVGRKDTAPAQAAPQVPATATPADGSDGGDH